MARVLHCFVAYKTVVSAEPLYSIGSDCARSFREVGEIGIWQRDKSHILTCDMKNGKGEGDGVRMRHRRARFGESAGWTERDTRQERRDKT